MACILEAWVPSYTVPVLTGVVWCVCVVASGAAAEGAGQCVHGGRQAGRGRAALHQRHPAGRQEPRTLQQQVSAGWLEWVH